MPRTLLSRLVYLHKLIFPSETDSIVVNSDSPRYLRANSINLGTSSGIFVLSIILLLYQLHQNKKKKAGDHDHVLEGKTADEIAILGQRHPGFLFKL